MQDLERDSTVEPGLAGTVDGGETALVDPDQVLVALSCPRGPYARLRSRAVLSHCHVQPLVCRVLADAASHGEGTPGRGQVLAVERFRA
jgi:hypothetical protein